MRTRKMELFTILRLLIWGGLSGDSSMFKALISGAVAIGLIAAPVAAGAMSTQDKSMSTHHKTHKVHHAQKKMMAPGTTTGMSSGTTTGQSTGAKAKTGY